jgi:hypothetical protein
VTMRSVGEGRAAPQPPHTARRRDRGSALAADHVLHFLGLVLDLIPEFSVQDRFAADRARGSRVVSGTGNHLFDIFLRLRQILRTVLYLRVAAQRVELWVGHGQTFSALIVPLSFASALALSVRLRCKC